MIPEAHKVFRSDNYFNLDLPKLANVLCRIPRFNAHTKIPISVGHHSLHCLYLAKEYYPGDDRLHQLALFHDVSEAYYGDIPTYIKRLLGEEARYQLNKIDQEIFNHLGITYPLYGEKRQIKDVDLNALTLEAQVGFEDAFHLDDWPTPNITDTFIINRLLAYPLYGLEEKLLQAFKEYIVV